MTPGTVVVGYLHDGTWSASFGVSFRNAVANDLVGARRITKEMGLYTTAGGLVESRNQVAKQFLDQTDGEWLWMVDTDMGFETDALERLVEQADPESAPVMGGLCFALKKEGIGESHSLKFRMVPTLYSYKEIEATQEAGFAPIMSYPRDSVVQVSATGAAFLLVHRTVLDRVRDEFGETWFNPAVHPTGLGGKPRVFSEDLSFCWRLAQLGIPVHVDTGIRTSHHKGGIYLTQDAFDREQLSRNLGPARISILCPTRGRLRGVERLVTSAMNTAQGPIEFIFYVDDDDEQTARALEALAPLGVQFIQGPRIVLSEMWNRCAEKANADVMMHCGDDIVFRTPGWDARVLAAFEKVPDRIVLVHGNDGHHRGNLGTHSFLHRRWVETLGYFVPPYFSSDYNDTWLTDVADRIGRRVYLEDVVTEHMHPIVGKGEWDQTHKDRLERHQRDDVAGLYRSLEAERAADADKLRAVMS